jgi:putative ABC transport system permease protein
MAKTYFKNLIRDIKKTFSRFISIVIIIAVGVAFYAGIRATCPSMQLSNDEFFKYSNFMDFKIISTLGLTEDDLSVISEVPGVSQAEGAFSMDAIIELNEDSLVVNVNSLPLNNGINKISLTKGRSAIRANEVVLEEVFMEAYDYNIGDEIVLTTGTDELITNSLEHSAYKIVGAAQSPLYISAQRQISPVGNGSVRGFVYLLPEAFKSDIFSEIYIRIDQPLSDSSLANNAEYKELAQIIEQRLEDIGDDRNNKRYDEVYKKLASQLKASQKELESAGADTLNSIAAAKTQLNQAQDELFQAEAQLVEAKISLDAEIAKMAQEIADLRRSLDEGQLQIELAKSEAAQNTSTAFAARLAEMKNILDQQPDNTVYQIEYNSLKQIYEQKIKGQSFESSSAVYSINSLTPFPVAAEIGNTLYPAFSTFSLKAIKFSLLSGKSILFAATI